MRLGNTTQSYGAIAIAFHWLVVALVMAQITLGAIAEDLPVGLERLKLLARHKSIGLTVFAIMGLRLLWRLLEPPPPLPGSMTAKQMVLAQLVHGCFYALLLALPVIGWTASSAAHISVSWFGLLRLPDLVSPDPTLARNLKFAHASLAWLLTALIVAHATLALHHQFILRDGVLGRMLPWLRNAKQEPKS